ncbi:hypothetical protein [Chromobacterium sp. CV08]|uniref:hypothetical protein n=1 Tax=Chromobacterium sp. CV08 TaxID=3133274 RepID=UPI003DA84D55
MIRKYSPRHAGALALSLGLAGALAGCGGGGGSSSDNASASNFAGASLALDVYGARGGTLTAVSSNCPNNLAVGWSSPGRVGPLRGASIDDPDPTTPLTVSASCGNLSTMVTLAAQNVFAAPSVFAVAKSDGSLAVWGSSRLGGDTSVLRTQPRNVVKVVGSERAWAALQADGTVVTWGRAGSGGSYAGTPGAGSADSTAPVAPLSKVRNIWALKRGFVALNGDGSATAWGNLEKTFDGNGGSASVASYFTPTTLAQFSDVVDVSYSEGAAAALKRDGTVFAWGDEVSGGDVTPVAAQLHDVVKIYSTDYSFTALRKDGSLVSWGLDWDSDDLYTGAQTMPQANLSLISNRNVIAALSQSGVVSAIGGVMFDRGADLSGFAGGLNNVAKVFASKTAFAALRRDGTVVSWGDAQRNNVASVQAQLSNVLTVASTETAFAALRRDGTVVSWGDETRGGDSSAVQPQLNNVVALFSNDYAFAALKRDGTVVSWGAAAHGGDSSAAQPRLRNIRAIYATALGGFLAVAKDGSFVNWGSPSAGGGAVPAGLTVIPYLKS